MSSKKWPGLATAFPGRSLLLVLLLGTLLLAACGDEVNEEPAGALPATRLNLADCRQAAPAASTTKAGAAVPTANSAGAGIHVDVLPGTRLFLSNTFPYALALPDSWEVKEGQVQSSIKGDLFIIKKGQTSGAYVTVISEKLSGQEDSKTYFDTKLKEATTNRKLDYEQLPDRVMGGSLASVLSFNNPPGQTFAYPVQSIQVLFTGQSRGWSVSFTASPNHAAQYCPYFARMLDSWAFTGLEK